jgi:hypothetical protein
MPESSLTTPSPRLSAPWAPSWIKSRQGLIFAAAAVLIAGAAALGWPWLVAAGIAPLLLAAAPCLAMCALGLCMVSKSGNTCSIATTQAAGGELGKPGKDLNNA